MTVKITKTSAQAQAERAIFELRAENKCPECGQWAIGVTHTKFTGFLNVRIEEKNSYSCWKCGCKWETDWKRK